MKFNASKSVTMIFSPFKAMRRDDYVFPLFSINGENLENVNAFKYLGHLISNDLSGNNDIVCSGRLSVVVTAHDFESGRPGSNPEWGGANIL